MCVLNLSSKFFMNNSNKKLPSPEERAVWILLPEGLLPQGKLAENFFHSLFILWGILGLFNLLEELFAPLKAVLQELPQLLEVENRVLFRAEGVQIEVI